jgi:hypothetical protein
MKLSELTEIYRRGGRKELISAMEEFSQAEKAQMLEDIGLAPRIGPGRLPEKHGPAVDVQPGDDESY